MTCGHLPEVREAYTVFRSGSRIVLFGRCCNVHVLLLQDDTCRIRIRRIVYQEGQPIFEFHVGGFDYARYAGN